MVVAGDLVADEFIYGQIDRVSREAPVLILKYDSTEIVPGGAGNAANNAAALGARVAVVGVVGRDAAGDRLLAGAVAAYVERDGRRPRRGLRHARQDAHPRRRRALGQAAGRADRSRRRRDAPRPPSRRSSGARSARCERADVVIMSDYGSGLITPELWRRVRGAATARKRRRSCSSTRATGWPVSPA